MSPIKILSYFVVFVVGFTAISLWNFYSITHPEEIPSLLTPLDAGLSAEDIALTAPDGITLAGWLIESEAPADAPALILLHGYPTDKGDLLLLARGFHEDFAILLVDARYFGESGGTMTTLGIKEHKDVQVAVSFLKDRGYDSVGLLGYSMGGSVALMAAGEDNRINAVATYGAFSDVRTLGNDVFSNLWFLKYPMTELMLFWGKIFIGNPLAYTPLDAAEKLDIPVLISHAQNDSFIPVSNVHRLTGALSGNEQAQTQIVEVGAHLGIPDEFVERARSFFKENLSVNPKL